MIAEKTIRKFNVWHSFENESKVVFWYYLHEDLPSDCGDDGLKACVAESSGVKLFRHSFEKIIRWTSGGEVS